MERGLSLYTEAKICINRRIKKGETILFEDRKEAENLAKIKRTYVYSALDGKGYFRFFAVPIR